MRGAEIDAYDLARLRHELTATRFVAFGMLLVAALQLGGVRRAIVATAFAAVAMVAYFLGLRWGLEGAPMSTSTALVTTLLVGALVTLLYFLGF